MAAVTPRLVSQAEPKSGCVGPLLQVLLRLGIAFADKNLAAKVKARPKADLTDPRQVPAPIPGLIASIAVTVGQKVAKGDRLLMMEAMKMQTTVSSPVDGVVEEIYVSLSDTVQSKDLLLKLRA